MTDSKTSSLPLVPEAAPLDMVAKLRNQAARDATRQKQLGGVALVAAVAFLVLIYIPSASALSALRQRIGSDARQLQVDQERSSLLPQLRATADLLEGQLSQIKPIAESSMLHDFSRRASDMSLQMQLRDLDYSPYEASLQGSVATLPVRLTLSGNFIDVYEFVRQCEQMPHLVRVQDLAIRQRPGEGGAEFLVPGDVDLEMTLVLYQQTGLAVAE